MRKTAYLLAVTSAFMSTVLLAQTRTTATRSHKGSSRAATITPADIHAAAIALGFTVNAGKIFDICDEAAEAPTRVDINHDGQSELVFKNGMCLGGMAGWFGIAARLPSGAWRKILDSQGVYRLLPTRHPGWPDIEAGEPGCSGTDIRYSWANGRYTPSGSVPRRCTDPVTATNDVRSPPAMANELPGDIEYIGYTGGEPYRIFNDLKLVRAGDSLSGSFFTKVGIFAGSSPLTGRYENGECTVVWRKDTYRGPCDLNGFSGTIYNKKGKAGDAFRFTSLAAAERMQANRTMTPAMPVYDGPPVIRSVWALGRVRIVTERGRRCGPEASLGKPFCFDRAIDWLRRRPDKGDVDVIAMDASYLPGSMVPYNRGQGWSVYRVARREDGFTADAHRHFATKVQVPMGCRYQGVLQNAWYITIAGGRKVAIEATQYNCGVWQGPWLYTRGADYADADATQLDYTGTAPDYRNLQQRKSSEESQPAGGVPFGFPPQRTRSNYGTSADIYDPPAGKAH